MKNLIQPTTVVLSLNVRRKNGEPEFFMEASTSVLPGQVDLLAVDQTFKILQVALRSYLEAELNESILQNNAAGRLMLRQGSYCPIMQVQVLPQGPIKAG